jgi:ATPase family protein associated with various cellular activities (AAA)
MADDFTNGSLENERASALASAQLVFNESVNLPYLPYSFFAEQMISRALPHVSTVQWMTDVESLDAVLPFATSTGRGQTEQAALLDVAPVVGGECLVYLYLRLGYIYGHVAARELPVLADAEEWVKATFPRSTPTDDRSVPLTFWSAGSHGAHAIARSITTPSWADVSANYPAGVRGEIEALLSREFHPSGGQLVLWYGPPGTGKTHALRALAWEWRSWCETHYVTDPESFFGRSNYMLDVLLQEDEDHPDNGESPKWRLLILEDTGELLAADAKEQAGQGLSRLLNVVDGIIGQGLRVLVLVTTNEPLTRLHPAVSRPGRCAARIEFGPFSAGEAAEWLAAHEVGAEPRQLTLAELFALQAGDEVETTVRLGFA